MLGDISVAEHIYIACGYTDMRKSIDGLAALVQEEFHLDPFSKSLFLFCGKRRDRMKILLWEGDGFLLFYKRLENGNFQWARKESDPFVGEAWEELYAYMFYDMKCSIVDDNGEKLLTSKRFLVAPHYGHTGRAYDTPEYVFEGIPQDMMSRIESLELDNPHFVLELDDPHFVIEGLYLQYGKVDTEKYDRELIKDLKEISIPISNIPVDDYSRYVTDDLFELLEDTRIHYSPDK